MNSKHSQLHESLARWFGDELPDWVLRPEVSFAVYGERGVIDILAWHPGRRALLVIELKTDIADVNELVGGVDRKRRLATGIARTIGWEPESVSVWVVVAAGRTNRARIAAHGTMLRAAFPMDGRSIRSWLGDPKGPVAALSMWRDVRPQNVTASSDAGPSRPTIVDERRRPRPPQPTTRTPSSSEPRTEPGLSPRPDPTFRAWAIRRIGARRRTASAGRGPSARWRPPASPVPPLVAKLQRHEARLLSLR